MAKNLDEQGEAKSAAPAIAKLPRRVCYRCRLGGVALMFTRTETGEDQCRNTVACRKRRRRLGPEGPEAPPTA